MSKQSKQSKKHHSGTCECDEDSFVDWDEDCHGLMDTRENRKEYPENFVWTCCGEYLTESEGCVLRVKKSPVSASPSASSSSASVKNVKWTHKLDRDIGELTVLRDSKIMSVFTSAKKDDNLDNHSMARYIARFANGLLESEDDGGVPPDEVRQVAMMTSAVLIDIFESD